MRISRLNGSEGAEKANLLLVINLLTSSSLFSDGGGAAAVCCMLLLVLHVARPQALMVAWMTF